MIAFSNDEIYYKNRIVKLQNQYIQIISLIHRISVNLDMGEITNFRDTYPSVTTFFSEWAERGKDEGMGTLVIFGEK